MKIRYWKRFIFLVLVSLPSLVFAIGNKNVVKLINQACQYLSSGEYEQSIASCNEAMVIDPGCAAVYYTRGFAYRYRGNYDQSISDFNRAIMIDPKYAAAYYGRAKTYCKKQEYEKAWEDVHKAERLGCKIEPEFLKELRKLSGKTK